jgi:hypothetical protein
VDIRLHDVKLSNIKAIGFDERSSTLRIAFHATADVYDYASVPRMVYSLLLASPSKGSVFQQHIVGKFKHTKVNPAKERIMPKKQTAKPVVQPQPVVQPAAVAPAPAPAPAAVVAAAPVPATPSKQEATITKLKEAWIERKVDLSKMTITDDGKYVLLIVDAGWPTVQIGNSGGITVLELKSYPVAFDAAVDGLARYTKQREREAKKVTAPAPTAPTPAPAPAVKETPTQRKQKQGAAVEAQLQSA